MSLQKISREEMARSRGGGRGAHPEYLAFFHSCQVGDGGRAVVADEGVSRQSVKNRLNVAAAQAGATIRYHRSGPEDVVFEVVEVGTTARRRGRPPKNRASDA
jgi:hypothetical protein